MSKVKFGETRFGDLLVTGLEGEFYVCTCKCGNTVLRKPTQLLIRRLQSCAVCSRERIDEILENKRYEREKNAHH